MRRLLFPLFVALSACSGATVAPIDPVEAGVDASPSDGASPTVDADPSVGDGTPVRNACTSKLGQGLTKTFGRLDGTIVSIVPTSQTSCNGDSTHVHLQVLMQGAVYDVAVNVDGLMAETSHAMVQGAWAEGWHSPANLDYPADLSEHSPAFATTNASALEQKLASVNHVSIFATGYGPDGAHLVHRNGGGHDGAVVLWPLSDSPDFLVFRFSTQSF